MTLHSHHRRALAVIGAALVLDAAGGVAFAAAEHVSVGLGLYWAVTTATTVGYGDITPKGWLPHLVAVAVMISVIPLFAAAFSLMTSGLTAGDVSSEVGDAESRIKDHVEARLRHHFSGGERT